jgi:hypothetical protein
MCCAYVYSRRYDKEEEALLLQVRAVLVWLGWGSLL